MEPINVIEGPVSVLDRVDVDTDQIMPKQFLKRVERSGFGEFLFYDWAKEDGWDLPKNPILVTGRNFGCGSSREHAPWGLEDYGFKAIIAPSYADIFHSNCTKIGLLPVALEEDEVRAVMAAGEARIDLHGHVAVDAARGPDRHGGRRDLLVRHPPGDEAAAIERAGRHRRDAVAGGRFGGLRARAGAGWACDDGVAVVTRTSVA